MRRNPQRQVPIEGAVRRALDTLRTGLRRVRKPCLAFSGGKDSIVLAHLAAQHGVRLAVRDNALTFWRVEHQIPPIAARLGIEVRNIDRFGRGWPFFNPRYLFPDTAGQARFYRLAQQTTIRRFAADYKHDGILLGRRRQENCVPAAIYKTAEGFTQIMPLWDWTTEEVWSYIKAFNLPVPDIYQTEVGVNDGCTTWNMISPELLTVSPYRWIHDWDPETWAEITGYDPRIKAYL